MDIRDRIVKTVAYFDLFDYPLTRAEVWRWLYQGPAATLLEVDEAVAVLAEDGVLQEAGGYVFASGREGIMPLRNANYRHSARKWRRARRWSKFFAAIPGVELVGIGNTLSFHNAKDGSDIDFFVVCQAGTIWRTRFFCALLPLVLGLRPQKKTNRDKLCLSFFVAGGAPDMSPYFLPTDEDIYFGYWLRQMVPLAGQAEAAIKFAESNYLVSRGELGNSPWYLRLLGWIGRLQGDFLKKNQLSYFPERIMEAAAKNDGSVVISDSALKLHIDDRRQNILARWRQRVTAIEARM
jgi:hypothetical protein